MNKPSTQDNILNTAIEAINRETGLRLDFAANEVRKDDKRTINTIVQIHDNGARLTAEIKKWAPQLNVGAIINQIKYLAEPGQGLLVADYINRNMGERLKEADVQFIDTAGNAYTSISDRYTFT